MIPKKIHYCWLSGDEMPKNLKKCMQSWKKYLPDYELVLWDTNKFDINSVPWVKEAFENKKYAFAADYIRCYALYTEGGIYLDTDVEVLKSFDPLLNLPYFIGKENGNHDLWEAATMGSEPGNTIFLDMMKYYENRHFLQNNQFDLKEMPIILKEMGEKRAKIKDIKNYKEFSDDDSLFQILPIDYFSPKSWGTGKISKTKNTFSIHHFESSWVPQDRRKLIMRNRLIHRLIPSKKLIRGLIIVKHLLNGTRPL